MYHVNSNQEGKVAKLISGKIDSKTKRIAN